MFKIAVTGPESTGKSILSKDLAEHFNTRFVPEYARIYLQNFDRQYTAEDIVAITKGQQELIQKEENKFPKILIADTEVVVCKIWMEYVFKRSDNYIDKALLDQYFDFYLLCYIDLPWTYDPLRENPDFNERKNLFNIYKNQLETMKVPYGIVQGFGNERLKNALKLIKPYLNE